MTVPSEIQCLFCKHYSGNPFRSCAAFPVIDGIPASIWYGDYDHINEYPGDRGIRFAPADGVVLHAAV